MLFFKREKQRNSLQRSNTYCKQRSRELMQKSSCDVRVQKSKITTKRLYVTTKTQKNNHKVMQNNNKATQK